MILAAIVIARNPAQYGFDLAPAAPLDYDKVKVPRPVDLRRVAEWAGTTVDEIQALNPELRRWTTPVSRTPDYELKVPAGRRRGARSPARRAVPRRHGGAQVVHGEARRHARDDCAEAAGEPHRPRRGELPVDARRCVSPGQNLIDPASPPLLLAARPDRPAPVVAEASRRRPTRRRLPPKPAPAAPAETRRR